MQYGDEGGVPTTIVEVMTEFQNAFDGRLGFYANSVSVLPTPTKMTLTYQYESFKFLVFLMYDQD